MKTLLKIMLFLALASAGFSQIQNMQAASGTTGDLTKPTLGFNLASGQTLNVKTGATVSGAGSYDFSTGAKLVIPNSAAPTTTSFGWIAGDNNAWAASRGAVQFFDGTANTYLVGALASSTPADGTCPTWHTGGTVTWDVVGSGTVTSGTATRFAYYPATATNVQSTPTMTVSSIGRLTMAPTALASGVTTALTFTTPGDTGMTANTESNQIVFGTVGQSRNWADSTAIPIQRDFVFNHSQVGRVSSFVNVTVGATVAVEGPPVPGSGNTITTPLSLWLQSGNLGFGTSGSIATIGSTSGGFTFSTAGTGTVAFTAVASSSTTVAINAGSGTTGASIPFQRAAVTKGLVALSSTTNNGITGSVADDMMIRSDVASILFSADAGASISGKFVATTGQFSLPKNIASTTTGTGSLIVAGGVGIAGDTFLGGKVVSVSPTAGVGYATGAGGTVTQITSRTTGVTLSKVTGAITLFSAAGSATPQTFTVTNTTVAATDTIIVNQKSGTDLYEIFVTAIGAGSFNITFFTTGGTTTEQPVFNFSVIKAVSS